MVLVHLLLVVVSKEVLVMIGTMHGVNSALIHGMYGMKGLLIGYVRYGSNKGCVHL